MTDTTSGSDDGSLPKWIPEKERCFFCYRMMDINTAYLTDDQSAVEVWYKCLNPECRCLKVLNKYNMYGMRFSGKYPELFKEFLMYDEVEEDEISTNVPTENTVE